MKQKANRLVAMLLCLSMLVCAVPFSASAAQYSTTAAGDYYKLISQKDWELAPGITESEIVLNNDAGDRRQVLHVVEVDMDNPYTKVIPSAKGMVPTAGNYGVQTMDAQAAYAEANGYGNVVAAMNISLSWYNSDYYAEHPELVGEPLGYMILDGVQYTNSQGKTSGAQTCLVINFDEKDGEARPADMPKVVIRSTSDEITGWEEQVIPANFGFLVKDGSLVTTTEDHSSSGAPRSMLGVKADGTIVAVMNDGRQAPYSTGLNSYEMGEIMLNLGCVYAINGDGGGSSQFLSQRPGEELETHCSPSDGALRATTHGVLIITTAPSDGEFVRAHVEAEHEYYTPNSTVQFTAVGADLVGTPADIPAEAVWQLSDSTMGTIDSNGLFTSNGTVGAVEAQLVYNGEVVGSAKINVVVPEKLSFSVENLNVPYEKSVELEVTATYGLSEVVLKDGDVAFTLSSDTLGTIEGTTFTATSDLTVSTGTITVRFGETDITGSVNLILGLESKVLVDFEDGQSGSFALSLATQNGQSGTAYAVTKETGMVRNGNGAYALELDFTNCTVPFTGGWAQFFFMNKNVAVEGNPTSFGFWIYLPEQEEVKAFAIRIYIKNPANGKSVSVYPVECGNIDRRGWIYISADLTSLGEFTTLMMALQPMQSVSADYGASITSKYTLYIDDFTFDYSTAVADREAPVFETIGVSHHGTDTTAAVNGQTIAANTVAFVVKASDDTTKTNYTGLNTSSAKVYIDGVQLTGGVSCTAEGNISVSDVTLPDGPHTIRVEISDNMGNVGYTEGQIVLAGGSSAPTVSIVPEDPDADKLPIGSVYWLNVEATAIEEVQSVSTVINLNSQNTWELDHMELAEGFSATYSINETTNNATVTITRTGEVSLSGQAVLAKLPIRTWESSRVKNGEYTAEQMWEKSYVGPIDIKLSSWLGKVSFTDGTESPFAMAPIQVDTELFSNLAGMGSSATEKTSWHQHTAEALEDKAATCTENGYSGRTFCAVCNSVVEWGTTATATGHDWQINAEGKLACANGGELFNGVYTDGKTYVDGAVIADGWNADNTAYYVDGVKLTGHQVMDGTMYTFSADGVYDADYQYNGLFDINGTVMYFVNNESQTGYQLVDGTGYYNFDENGYGFNGFVEINGTQCLFEKGVSVKTDEVLLAGICGEGVYYVIYADGRMVICGSGEMMDFTGLNHNPWWRQEYRFNIKSITIGKDITRIGMRAFIDTYATEVIFEEGSKLTEIFTHGFSLMDGLTEITIPDGVKTLGVQAFYNCPNLKDVYLPTSATNIISNTFTGSPNVLIHVAKGAPIIAKLEALGLSYVTYDAPLGSGSCGEATTWTLAGDGVLKISGTGAMDDYAAATAPWYAFRDSITAVEIGAEVTTVGKFSFFNCLKLKSVSFAENGALEAIGWGAFGYTGLESVTIPATVKTLNDYAFYNCAGLKTVAVAEGSVMNSIGRYAFWNDVALQSAFIPDGVSKINTGAFENTGSVKVSVAEGGFAHTYAVKNGIGYEVREAVPVQKYSGSCGENTTWSLWSNGVLKITGTGAMTEYAAAAAPWYAYRNEITSVEIGAEVTTVGKFSFFNCLKLKSVSFAENGALEAIGWGAFGYTGLESVTIPATVKTLNDYAFYQSKELKAVTFAENSALTSVGRYAFWNTTSLMEISGMPEGVKIGTNAFLDSSYPAE